MLRITFLGTSGSTPTTDRGMPALAIKYESELMLWDCGEGTQRQLMKYKVGYGSIDHIFISHPHLDHYLGLFGLLETLKLSSAAPRPLNLFVPKNMDFENYKFAKVSKLKNGMIYRGKDFTVSAFPVKHVKNSFGFIFQEDDKIKFHEDKAHSLGLQGKLFREIQKKGKVKTEKGEIKLEDVSWKNSGRKIVYGGDCLPDDNLTEAARNADVLIHEATFDSSKKEDAEERMHSTAEDAALIAKKAKVKQLVLTHVSPRYANTNILLEQAKNIFPQTKIAEDGFSIDL
ncbi:Ribonuclease Z [Candidatus Bilamarchaeum dharawalense]|uniref:Ribonuclease Z n=1 Tax=Candidatus Bilamarchaeum dharawalense TaxID=2885759 RepID=A0A5E4LS49_9ARCH|nr:Ribonuclease Z [Candidatus Bilamarchaeum dharawalense]